MVRSCFLAALLLVPVAACSTPRGDRHHREMECVDAGNVVLWADPSDQRDSTMMIGCITPTQYAELFDSYTKIEEVSDD